MSFNILSNAASESPVRRELRGLIDDFGITLIIASDVDQPSMKLSRSFLSVNFSSWRASMSNGLIRFRFAVSVSFADENTRSHGTDVAWTGR